MAASSLVLLALGTWRFNALRVPAPTAGALVEFRNATAEDSTRAAVSFGLDKAELATRGWWWRRLPDPRPWPHTE